MSAYELPTALAIAPITEEQAALNERALAVATTTAQQLGIDRPLHTLRIREATSWIFTDGIPTEKGVDETTPTVAIRLTTGKDPQQLHDETVHNVSLLQQLREPRPGARPRQAPVQNFIGNVVLQDDFVATTSEYLPHGLGSLHAYGGALALLHNVSEQRPEVTRQAAPFTPLSKLRESYEFFRQHPDLPWVTPQFMEETFGPRLQEGEAAIAQMLDLSKQRGYPLVVMQHDVTLGNALRDRNGVTTLIDMEGMMHGPAEFALGRPLGQWHAHFNRPRAWGDDIRSGYEQTANRRLDPDILRSALFVSRLKYAGVALNQIVEAVMLGQEPSPWAVHESTRRLTTLGQAKTPWFSQHDYLRQVQERQG